jgi:predicted metal-dependent enzyme (double-stranded beta helix superfamily)
MILAQQKHPSLSPVEERRVGAIAELAARVSQACGEAPLAMKVQVKSALARAATEPGLLSAQQRQPETGCYARHVLYADPAGRFTVIAIVWSPGQFSPPHAHPTWCSYVVYEGELHETEFAWNGAALRAEPQQTETRGTGYSCYAEAGLDQIHRLGNSSTRPAISIHVYGVARDHIATRVNRLVEIA